MSALSHDQLRDWFHRRMAEIGEVVFSHPDPNQWLEELPNSKSCLFYVGSFLSQVDNGGVWEYLCGPFGDDIGKAVRDLNLLGAGSMAQALDDIRHALPEGFFGLDRSTREATLKQLAIAPALESLNKVVFARDSDAMLRFLHNYWQAGERAVGKDLSVASPD